MGRPPKPHECNHYSCKSTNTVPVLMRSPLNNQFDTVHTNYYCGTHLISLAYKLRDDFGWHVELKEGATT